MHYSYIKLHISSGKIITFILTPKNNMEIQLIVQRYVTKMNNKLQKHYITPRHPTFIEQVAVPD
jgi:hypothetical protein